MHARSLMAVAVVLAMVGGAFGVLAGNASAAQGTPDSYGYSYTDSKAPAPSVAFNWVEINSTGTDTGLTYYWQYTSSLPIGFTFEFYGTQYTEFYATTNGFIGFGYGTWENWNYVIPYQWNVNNIVAAYWDELENYDGTIYYETIGVSPNRQLVVEWENVTDWSGSSYMTFEIILNETGDIWYQYLTLNGMDGSSATVGIENDDGTVGTQYSYNTGSLTDSLAVRFSEGPVSIGPDLADMGAPGETIAYDLTVVNRQSFSDSFAITYSSVEGWTVSLYDSFMNPLIDTDGDLLPDTGTVPSYSSVAVIVTVDIPLSPAATTETTAMNASSFAAPSVFDTCILTTGVRGAWFTPPHNSYGEDTESDGDFNYLVVEISVDVYYEGWYYFEGALHTSSEGYLASAYLYPYLFAGSQTVEMRFYGWLMREAGVDGPYHVHLTLYDGSSWEIIDEDVHYTASYLATEFMEVPADFAPPFSDRGVDADGDGLYDYMVVDVVLDVNYATDFRVLGYLYDPGGSYVGYSINTSGLSIGTRTVQLVYDAWDISKAATESGQFEIYIYLSALIDSSWPSLSGYWYLTSSYDLADFERPDAMFGPTHDEHTVDSDGDFEYDFLVIDVSVNVSVEGDYSVEGILSGWYGVIDTDTNVTHLTVGVHTVELAFPGWPIYYNDDYDDFDVDLYLRTAGVLLDEDYYETDYYWYSEFEGAPGWFEPPYVEYGLDLNGDILYDYLVIEVPVTVTVAGTYEVYAELEYIWTITDDSNTTYLPAGTTVVELRFVGWVIRNDGWDGPYDVYIYLYDTGMRQMDYDWFSTAAYAYTDFQGEPGFFGWPHESFVEDSDGDGDFDGLFVNATVIVDVAGTFIVRAILYDSGWSWVASTGTTATLAAGTQTVQLAFPAWAVYAHGVNGTFRVELYLYDAAEPSSSLDYDWFSTSIYYYDDFDRTVPRIDSSWAATAPIVDGTHSAGEWAGATAVELTVADPWNGLEVTLLVMNDASNLYISYDAYGDTRMDSWDYSSIAFDTRNDDTLTDEEEDQFFIEAWSPDDTAHLDYESSIGTWVTHCSPFDDLLADHSGLAGAVGFGPSDGHATDHRIYEYSIPLDLLGMSAGDVVGFFGGSPWSVGVYDDWTGFASAWPMYYSSSPAIDLYGEIATALSVSPSPPTTTASVAGTAGSSGWYKSGVNVTLSATGGEGGIDYTEYRLDGGSWTTYSAAIAIMAEGTHTLEYRSVDMVGQVESTRTLSVKIDRTAPSTTESVSGANVTLAATDATSGVATTKYRIDGGSWLTYTGVVTITETGTHTVEFYSVDVAGNQESTQSVTVQVEGDLIEDGILGGAMLLVALGVLAAVVALVLVLLLMKRKKGQQPAAMVPPPPGPPMAPPVQ